MATVEQVSSEQRFLLHDVDWQFYKMLRDALPDRPIRITYDHGNLEMMTVSREHERYKTLIGRLIEEFTATLDIPLESGGSTTWRREDLDRGLEPDECYYIRNEPLVCDKEEIDLSVDPPPDLAVEVEISRSLMNRVSIYAALGVPELWRYDGSRLRVCHLQNGAYVEQDRSLNLPLLEPSVVQRFLKLRETMRETACIRAFRDWLAEAFPEAG